MLYKRRKKLRKPGFDYRTPGLYFVTINTKNNNHWFGYVENEQMVLNKWGEIAHQQWHWLSRNFPYIQLHEFIIMPNHIHGTIQILDEYTRGSGSPSPKPLSQIIAAFKTTSSKWIRQNGLPEFTWHRSFHDRIIDDENDLARIALYIRHNPREWHKKRNP